MKIGSVLFYLLFNCLVRADALQERAVDFYLLLDEGSDALS